MNWILSATEALAERVLLALTMGWNWISEEWVVGLLSIALILGIRFALRARV